MSYWDGLTDGQTDGQTHDDNIYRASIASRGKNEEIKRSSATAEGPRDALLVNSFCFTSSGSYKDFKQQN